MRPSSPRTKLASLRNLTSPGAVVEVVAVVAAATEVAAVAVADGEAAAVVAVEESAVVVVVVVVVVAAAVAAVMESGSARSVVAKTGGTKLHLESHSHNANKREPRIASSKHPHHISPHHITTRCIVDPPRDCSPTQPRKQTSGAGLLLPA